MPTKIEWTTSTWNPITGCTPISPGCQNCYAKTMSRRLAGLYGYPEAPDNFKVTLHPDKLYKPLHWKKPQMIFVCSMGDLFHKDVLDEWIDQVFYIMVKCPQHVFQILTKRPERMHEYFHTLAKLNEYPEDQNRIMRGGHIHYQEIHAAVIRYRKGESQPNVWLGVTCENQATADERIPWLLKTPAAVRFVSAEPLLEPIDFQNLHTSFEWYESGKIIEITIDGLQNTFHGITLGDERIDQIIVGAETGQGKRPMPASWARSIRDQCKEAGVPFFFKKDSMGRRTLDGEMYEEYPDEWKECE